MVPSPKRQTKATPVPHRQTSKEELLICTLVDSTVSPWAGICWAYPSVIHSHQFTKPSGSFPTSNLFLGSCQDWLVLRVHTYTTRSNAFSFGVQWFLTRLKRLEVPVHFRVPWNGQCTSVCTWNPGVCLVSEESFMFNLYLSLPDFCVKCLKYAIQKR